MLKQKTHTSLSTRSGGSSWSQLSTLALLMMLLVLLAVPPLAHALYVKIEGDNVTWSDTKLGGGPRHPTFWVQVNVPAGYTGVKYKQDFVSMSPAFVYGTYQTVTFGPEHMLPESKLRFQQGQLVDLNLLYDDPTNERLLVCAGEPSAHCVYVNTPKPPCILWPDFPSLNFCGARIAIKTPIPTTATEPTLSTFVDIPPTLPPTYPAEATVNMSGDIEFNANGGLFFSGFSPLNKYGPYGLTVVLSWAIAAVDEPAQQTPRVWFSHTGLSHTVTANGNPVSLGDDDYWALGNKVSWVEMKSYTAGAISSFCAKLALPPATGICYLSTSFNQSSGYVHVGFFNGNNAAGIGSGFITDLSKVTGFTQLSSHFGGQIMHQANPQPVWEQ